MNSRKIAVASTFSPRFLSVLAEAARLAKGFEGNLHIIHAAEKTEEKETRFREGFASVGLPEDTPVFWVNASTPMEAILSAVEDNKIEILIAGALEREPEHRNFTGNVARNLLLKCHCDLVLLTRPEATSGSVSRIALAIDLMEPDVKWLSRALEIATLEGQPLLNVFSIVTPFDKLRDNTTTDSAADLETRMEGMVKEAGGYKGEIDYRVIVSNTGFNACEVIQALEPNLLLARRSRGPNGELSLPTHMDWLPQVIPANAMIFAAK